MVALPAPDEEPPPMKTLLVISSAPLERRGDRLVLDGKFLDGMAAYCAGWDGPVRGLLQKAGGKVPFGREVAPDDLPFTLEIAPPGTPLTRDRLAGCDVILCSGDTHRYFYLADLCRGLPVRLCYIIEYILETRLQIIDLDPRLSWPRKAYAALWTRRQERRRRRAFARADGLQANGYPAAAAYGGLNARTVRYLDNRIGTAQMATPGEMAARRARLLSGAPLRLVHSGRLEPMKGSQDLVPVARRLKAAGVAFHLDIFGSGSLEGQIRAGVAEAGLQEQVTLHGSVDFAAALVPFTRQTSDIFLSCHRQSDPSCTYLEALGCGVALAGYGNRMWQALAAESQAGWVAPLGDPGALAEALIAADRDRAGIAAACERGRAFAGNHTFETEFGRRLEHLVQLAQMAPS